MNLTVSVILLFCISSVSNLYTLRRREGCYVFHTYYHRNGSLWKFEEYKKFSQGIKPYNPCIKAPGIKPITDGTFTVFKLLPGVLRYRIRYHHRSKYWKVLLTQRSKDLKSKVVVSVSSRYGSPNKSVSIYSLPAIFPFPRFGPYVMILHDIPIDVTMEYVPVTRMLAKPMYPYHIIVPKDAGKMFISYANYHATVGDRILMGRIISGTWSDAAEICNQTDYQLFSITGKDDLTLLKQLYAVAKLKFANRQYLGLKNGRWVDGNPLIFSEWYQMKEAGMTRSVAEDFIHEFNISLGATNFFNSDYCTLLLESNLDIVDKMSWLPVPCNSTYPEVFVLCEKKNVTNIPTNKKRILKKDETTCADGYLNIQGVCLSVLSTHTAMNYESAARKCASIRGRLASEQKSRLPLYQVLLHFTLHEASYGGLWVDNFYMLHPNISIVVIKDKTDTYSLKYSYLQALFNVLCERQTEKSEIECGKGLYTCNDGSCILAHTLCDGVPDCNQAEDEEECPNRVHHFICSDNQLISPSMYCDSVVDCRDGSDEKNCSVLCEEYDEAGNVNYNCSEVKTEVETRSSKHLVSGLKKYEMNLENSWYLHPIANTTINYEFCPAQDEVRCDKEYQLCIPRHKVCVYETDIDGSMLYCPNGEHLHDCETFQCPHLYKCPDSYCIHYHSVCNGVKDCIGGHDEMDCGKNLSCPGLFKCHGESVCVDQRFRCDGRVHCPVFGSDEHQCEDVSIPLGCSYKTGSLICTNRNVFFSDLHLPTQIRVADLSNINTESFLNTKINTPYLMKLFLNHSSLRSIPPGLFSGLGRLLELDLSHNSIAELSNGTFSGLSRLQHLHLAGNPLSILYQGAFSGLQTLRVMNLQNLKLSTIQGGTFLGLPLVTIVMLQKNYLTFLDSRSFLGLVSLEHLDVTSNPLEGIDPQALANLRIKSFYTDEYSYCCFPMDVANCHSKPSLFSSCADLMANQILQVTIWILGSFSLVGNIVIILWKIYKREQSSSTLFTINLAISDFLMGVYLIIIASADLMYRGTYARYDHHWRSSYLCRFAGVISTVSGLVSNVMLAFISHERLTAVVWPLSYKRHSHKKMFVCLIVWITVPLLSTVPIMKFNYFGNQFIKNGVCLFFNMSEGYYKGWEFMTILLGFNLSVCIFMLISHLWILETVRSSRRRSGRDKSDEESVLARKLSRLVLTNAACWLPIIITSILSLSGVSVHPQVAAWMVVFVLPLNSAINPYLYSQLTGSGCCKRSEKKRKVKN